MITKLDRYLAYEWNGTPAGRLRWMRERAEADLERKAVRRRLKDFAAEGRKPV